MSDFIGGVFGLAAAIACLAAWISSVVFAIKTENWILLAADLLVAPIGVIHGIILFLQ